MLKESARNLRVCLGSPKAELAALNLDTLESLVAIETHS